jgi:hypothetical protein
MSPAPSRTLKRARRGGDAARSLTAMAAGRSGIVFVAGLLLAAVAAGPARAQSFGPPLLGEVLYQLQDREGNPRLTLEAYSTFWRNPFEITLMRVAPGNPPRLATRTVRLVAHPAPSPLVEATYHLGGRWSLGFWYNPIRGERLSREVKVGGVPVDLDLTKDTDLTDFHLVYYGPRGLSAQVGYYREHGTIRDQSSSPLPRLDFELQSWNVWLNGRLDVRSRCQILTPFLSVGYHPSAELRHAVSALIGIAVTVSDRLSLSASVWEFDLSHPSTRVTAGLLLRQ